jgi:8-amino-7-oxononanoate synthase
LQRHRRAGLRERSHCRLSDKHRAAFRLQHRADALQAVLVKRALELVRDEPQRRAHLSALKALAATCLSGFPVKSQIVPIIVGQDGAAVELAKALQTRGFDIRAIRPPSVPEGTARLRLSLHAGLKPHDIEEFSAALLQLLPQICA